MGNGVPIHVLGTSFAIQTDESPEYVQKLVRHLTSKIETLQKSLDTKDSLRIVIIAAVLIADELFKEREKRPRPTRDNGLEDMAENIMAKLDKALDVES